jgi:heat-inducible transcriptional repressor
VISDVGKITSQLTSYPTYAMTAVTTQLTISRFDLIYVDAGTFIAVAMLSNNSVKNRLIKLTIDIDKSYLTKLSTLFNAQFTNITDEEMTSSLVSSMERAIGDTDGVVASIASFAMEAVAETKSKNTFVTGASHLLEHPEFHDVDKAQKVLEYLSNDNELMKLPVPEQGGMKITIGPENLAEELKDSSVIVARYDAGGGVEGLIGVVGPTRMDYSKVAARLDYIAKGMSWLLTGSEFAQGSQSRAMPEHREQTPEENDDKQLN